MFKNFILVLSLIGPSVFACDMMAARSIGEKAANDLAKIYGAKFFYVTSSIRPPISGEPRYELPLMYEDSSGQSHIATFYIEDSDCSVGLGSWASAKKLMVQ